MTEICPQEKCTSCFACKAVCPTDAITVTIDRHGFYKPAINDACIDCGNCRSICQGNELKLPANELHDVFAAFTSDDNIRQQSSSGGVFSLLAQQVLANGGVVFGAILDECFTVRHVAVENQADFMPMRGSKYVQSLVGNCYREVRGFLAQERQVLFSGTPCQLAGLQLFLGDSASDDSLILVDLVCHGVPSPRIFKDYLSYLENLHEGSLQFLSFRDKSLGWKSFGMKAIFANGREYFASHSKDPYVIGFLKNYFLNPSCYHCPFANTDRPGDLTIADFWGYQNTMGQLADDDKGITLVIANNKKGLNIYENLTGLVNTKSTIEEAAAGNAALRKASYKNRLYDEFWADYEKNGFSSFTIEKYFMPKKAD